MNWRIVDTDHRNKMEELNLTIKISVETTAPLNPQAQLHNHTVRGKTGVESHANVSVAN